MTVDQSPHQDLLLDQVRFAADRPSVRSEKNVEAIRRELQRSASKLRSTCRGAKESVSEAKEHTKIVLDQASHLSSERLRVPRTNALLLLASACILDRQLGEAVFFARRVQLVGNRLAELDGIGLEALALALAGKTDEASGQIGVGLEKAEFAFRWGVDDQTPWTIPLSLVLAKIALTLGAIDSTNRIELLNLLAAARIALGGERRASLLLQVNLVEMALTSHIEKGPR